MLLRTKGVVKASISYRKALAAVSYDPSLVTPEELEKRIKALGYETGERSRVEHLLDLGCVLLTILLVWLLLRWGGVSPEIGGASFGTLFLVGLSTSPHCLGMCGGILLSACEGHEGRKAQLGAALGYNGGRMISYTALGAAFGALGTVLTYTLSMKSMLFTMLGLVVALLGLNMWGLLPTLPSLPGEPGTACRLSERLRRQAVPASSGRDGSAGSSPHIFKPSRATASPSMVNSIDFMLSVYVSTVPKAPNTAPSAV